MLKRRSAFESHRWSMSFRQGANAEAGMDVISRYVETVCFPNAEIRLVLCTVVSLSYSKVAFAP